MHILSTQKLEINIKKNMAFKMFITADYHQGN